MAFKSIWNMIHRGLKYFHGLFNIETETRGFYWEVMYLRNNSVFNGTV